MHAGHYISGVGHAGLIGWLLLGGVFTSEPLPFEVQEVSVITGAEFEAMMAAQRPPQTPQEVAQPAPPTPAADLPDLSATPDRPVQQPKPEPAQTPQSDPPPAVAEEALPPEAEVSDSAPELEQPSGDVAVLVPDLAPRAVPRPVPRVAPAPVAQPAPDARPDPTPQEAQRPEPAPDAAPEPPQEAAAPEEATTEIVTEATSAPKASPRPPGRRPAAPARPAPSQTANAAKPQQDSDADAIAAAVAAAQAEASNPDPAPAAPSGPPLTAGEKENLRVAVSRCWNVGSLSSEALQTTVVVSVQMAQDGTPIVGSIRMIGSEGGSASAAKQAYEAARRAIIRCGAKGYDLPAEKFGQWQSIEMTFNPERMRVK